MTDRIDDRNIIEIPPKGVKTSIVTAQRCPVCNGFGTLKYGSLICHGCKGRGYVFVPTEREDNK